MRVAGPGIDADDFVSETVLGGQSVDVLCGMRESAHTAHWLTIPKRVSIYPDVFKSFVSLSVEEKAHFARRDPQCRRSVRSTQLSASNHLEKIVVFNDE